MSSAGNTKGRLMSPPFPVVAMEMWELDNGEVRCTHQPSPRSGCFPVIYTRAGWGSMPPPRLKGLYIQYGTPIRHRKCYHQTRRKKLLKLRGCVITGGGAAEIPTTTSKCHVIHHSRTWAIHYSTEVTVGLSPGDKGRQVRERQGGKVEGKWVN